MQARLGQRVVGLVAKSSTDYIRKLFELLQQGCTVVALQSEADDGRKTLAGVEEVVVPGDGRGWVEDLGDPNSGAQENQIAQIIFTSGTEGASKAILLSHGALSNTTDRLVSVMEMDSDIREYVGIPVSYSFGFGRCRAVSRVGGAFYVPPNGFDPSEISEMLARDEINALSAVPTLWRVLLQSKEMFAGIGEKLRWIEIGSQYMSCAEKEQLKQLFPNAKIVQHYGLTEASRSTFLKIHEYEDDQLESVGVAMDGVDVDISDAGQIRIRGPHLASGMLLESGEQALTDEEGWFTTSDSGRIKDGFLWYEGRSDDLINCGGTKLSPDAIERELSEYVDSSDVLAVSKVNDSLRGEVPIIAVLNSARVEKSRIEDASTFVLRSMGLESGKVAKVFEVDSFPRTETGKLQRKKLTKAYLDLHGELDPDFRISESVRAGESTTPRETQQLMEIWQDVLKISPIGLDESFFDLGGDSLSAISVTMRMEKAGIPKETCRRIFEGWSIAQIVESQSARSADAPLTESESIRADDNQSGQQSKLVAIWEEVLKVSPISVNDSFFDLGGDSLSAISVTMKMEKAGIPKEVCRRIFEGWSIARIVDSQAQEEAGSKNTSSDKTAELVGIWEEVLKVSPISVNDSFFDLGGDSLSAITVTIKMEKAGIPKETCRKIFEGLSIADIVEQPAAESARRSHDHRVQPESKSQPHIEASTKTPLAAASESLNIVRGILVLLNVASHWMPGVMARVPGIFSEINKYFAPLYSSGTPGFAIVFGSGIGFFFLPRFLKDPASVRSVVFRNTVLLAAGISLYAALSTFADFLSGNTVSGLSVLGAFWSVLTFYLLAVMSLPFWLRLLTMSSSFSYSCIGLASLFYLIHLLIVVIDIPPSENPFLQFFVLVLTAKYNYFEMSAGVLVGAAVGNWIRSAIMEGRSLGSFTRAGLFLILAAAVISYEMGEIALWTVWPKGLSLWTWPLYLGCVLIGITMVQRFVSTRSIQGGLAQVFKALAIIGIVAFPIFIAHELVIPVKNALFSLGVPFALPIALLAFFSGSAYLVHRLHSVYYGGRPFSLGRLS